MSYSELAADNMKTCTAPAAIGKACCIDPNVNGTWAASTNSCTLVVTNDNFKECVNSANETINCAVGTTAPLSEVTASAASSNDSSNAALGLRLSRGWAVAALGSMLVSIVTMI
jgi:hypothetical protein